MTGNSLETNYIFDGLSDTDAIQAEIVAMRDRLGATSAQMALERSLAMTVHKARSNVVLQNPILKKIIGTDSSDGAEPVTAASMLSAAFVEDVNVGQLPEQLVNSTGKQLRVNAHPDAGGDAQEAANIAKALEGAKVDPVFSIVNAVLAAKSTKPSDIQSLRNERYKLQLLLDAAKPHYSSPEEVESYTNKEIEGADWRIRTVAAFKCFELIIGSPEKLHDFLQVTAYERNHQLMAMINHNLPYILKLNERIAKGDPVSLSKEAKDTIDKSLGYIWDTLYKGEDDAYYMPPYQNWFPILIPVLEKLDPGKKEGEEYTQFKPPFEVVRTRNAPLDADRAMKFGKLVISLSENIDDY
jgi:hypothetical protein